MNIKHDLVRGSQPSPVPVLSFLGFPVMVSMVPSAVINLGSGYTCGVTRHWFPSMA